ncbi:MAG: hypothetical protein ACI861_002493, partial [Paracoccaceae bacterium]
ALRNGRTGGLFCTMRIFVRLPEEFYRFASARKCDHLRRYAELLDHFQQLTR